MDAVARTWDGWFTEAEVDALNDLPAALQVQLMDQHWARAQFRALGVRRQPLMEVWSEREVSAWMSPVEATL